MLTRHDLVVARCNLRRGPQVNPNPEWKVRSGSNSSLPSPKRINPDVYPMIISWTGLDDATRAAAQSPC